jgi:hypothetical protein
VVLTPTPTKLLKARPRLLRHYARRPRSIPTLHHSITPSLHHSTTPILHHSDFSFRSLLASQTEHHVKVLVACEQPGVVDAKSEAIV